MESFTVFADYFQIQILDKESEIDLGPVWAAHDVRQQFATTEDAVIIGTSMNTEVVVEADVLEAAPRLNSTHADYEFEFSIRVPSGQLVVMGCSDYLPDATVLEVSPGWNRVRVSRTNVSTGLAAEIDTIPRQDHMERIKVSIWPSPREDSRILAI